MPTSDVERMPTQDPQRPYQRRVKPDSLVVEPSQDGQ
jgi:hypothetical protein